jgi:hypothetical protein
MLLVKMAVFRVVAPCSLAEVNRRFRGTCCLHYQGAMMMEAATSETSVNFYQTTRRCNPEGNLSLLAAVRYANNYSYLMRSYKLSIGRVNTQICE